MMSLALLALMWTRLAPLDHMLVAGLLVIT